MAKRKIWEGTRGNDIYRVYWDSEWQEYTGRTYPGGVLYEAADYFDTDKQGAIDNGIGQGFVEVVKGAKKNPAGRSGHDNGYNAALLDIGKKGWDFAKNKLNRELPPGKKPIGMTAETLDYWRGYGLAVVDNMVKANPAKRKAPMAKAPRKNPAKKSYTFGIHLNAGKTANGNPRRLFVLYSSTGNVVDIIDEGYRGIGAVSDAGYSTAPPIVGQFRITPGEYAALLKRKK